MWHAVLLQFNRLKASTMINTKELRIGNIIFNGTIREIHEHYFIFEDDYVSWDSRNVIPEAIIGIELSPDVLKKCGFQKMFKLHTQNYANNAKLNFGYPVLYLNEHNTAKIRTNNSGKCEYLFTDDGHRINCKYLHQLQNLYFALTGRELEISK